MHTETLPNLASAFAVILVTLTSVLFVCLTIAHHKFIWIVLRTLKRDLKGTFRASKILFELGRVQTKNKTVGNAFNQTVAKHPDKICFYFEDEKWSFKDVHELTNKIGNYFSAQGFQKGDVVAIFMHNSPEYPATWLGLSKIGVVSALINTNLRMESLTHSIEIVKCKAIVYSEELSDAIKDLQISGDLHIPIFSWSKTGIVKNSEATDLSSTLRHISTKEPIPSDRINFNDDILYIYTSGTTGLPKAATVKHIRCFAGGNFGRHSYDIKTDDVLYMCLPLYHSAGCLLGLGQTLFYGTTMVLRKKFSATNFWSDCTAYDVTVVQYIGEICRYLLAQPERPEDNQHKVRLMLGNGLRKEIWEKFVRRFNIGSIGELYGSTEGNASVTNFDGTVGAVGFVPRLLYSMMPYKIIRVNEQTGEIIRDPKTGLGIICKPNEPGEFVGTIVKNNAMRDFNGYAGTGANEQEEKKIARNVFKNGDAVFRTGDHLVMDELGYFYFKDRCGDTFRWKGENVSTAEVESVISSVTQLNDCVVYGVEIPGTEGRAGMAAIVDINRSLDLKSLVTNLGRRLPTYARPLFLRITDHIDTTGTYKLKKLDLQKEGFDVEKVSDAMYFYHGDKFVPLEKSLYAQIVSGGLRL